MTDFIASLGLVGTAVLIAWLAIVAYWASRPLRPAATWVGDLQAVRAWWLQRRPSPTPKASGHPWWPRMDGGPRMWRWPLNSTRAVAVGLWAMIRLWPGPIGLAARLAWHPAAAIGAAAAIVQALVLMAIITAPVALLAGVIDTTTVLRGGMPPAKPRTARKTAAMARARAATAEQAAGRLAEVQHHLSVQGARP